MKKYHKTAGNGCGKSRAGAVRDRGKDYGERGKQKMKEMKRETMGTGGALVKKPRKDARQTVSGPAGKAAWKIPACYVLWAVLTVLFTALISLCLGMNGSVPGERGKTTVEILSSLLGSIYISFLLGRWKDKEWEVKRTPGQIKAGLMSGTALFICRLVSRLVFSLFQEEVKGVGYLTVLMIDLICMILIYSQLPAGGKEEESHD